MSAFATLASLYNMPAALGSTRDVSRADPISHAFEQFFVSVERQAFKMAQIALRNEDDALDAVQDAMLVMVRSYSDKPPPQWRPLFYRVLQNRVRDLQRRRSVRSRFMAWLPGNQDELESVEDPMAQVASGDLQPAARLQVDEAIGALELALAELPDRQREAFMLRNFEGMDVAETATTMGCSDGSVKTHYFRALQQLRTKLGEHWE